MSVSHPLTPVCPEPGIMRFHVPDPPGSDPEQTPEIPPPQRDDEDIDLPPREDPAPVRDPEKPQQPH